MRLTSAVLMVFTLMWGTFFIETGISLFIGLLVCLGVIYVSLAKNNPIDTVGVVVLANVIYWIAHGFIVDALDLSSFLDPKLYSGEGRIFLSLLPLFALCCCAFKIWDLKASVFTLYTVGIASIVIYVIWLGTGTTMLSGPGHADEFHGFLSSHTGSGTFFGALAVFFIIYTAERQRLLELMVALLLLGPMFSSGSREALVGAMAALGWYWGIKRKHPRIMVAVCLGALLMIPVVGSMSNKTYNRTVGLISWDTVDGIVDQAKVGINSDWQIGDWSPEEDTGNLESGDVTTLVRIMLWVYASKRFIDSPFVGMGWGRFNDTQLVMTEVPFMSTAAEGNKLFSTANGHNSYFHVLAESGLFGLLLYMAVWVMIFTRSVKAERLFRPYQSIRSYYVACQGLVIYILICALTGHALASPSVMVPVVTILGIGLAFYRNAVKVAAAETPTDKL